MLLAGSVERQPSREEGTIPAIVRAPQGIRRPAYTVMITKDEVRSNSSFPSAQWSGPVPAGTPDRYGATSFPV